MDRLNNTYKWKYKRYKEDQDDIGNTDKLDKVDNLIQSIIYLYELFFKNIGVCGTPLEYMYGGVSCHGS